ncbi:MAG: sporulation protein YqfD [Eubacterium sp.]|nr:sporulation protein YqfD [Eubacterium sp.]MDD7209133.1 sporulation protein YqfD [Lachnospiraceae bacterium]MDY5497729.1 sporulation protein YqfD [Anaerobutyricum sp.]
MLFSFFHLLDGYCSVVLKGRNQERFLNLCASRNILLWNLKRKERHYIFCVSRRGLRELEEISRKTGVDFQCMKKRGLPFMFYRYRGRKIFVLALFLAAAGLLILSRFLWQIDVSGCYTHSGEEMNAYLKKNGIESGTRLSNISCEKLEEKIRQDFSDIAWVSCEKRGTALRVYIKETVGPETKADKEGAPCNLIATKKGKIDSILVRSGSAKVKKGDEVKPGDVLISGIVGIQDDSGEISEEITVRARGDIYEISSFLYEDRFPMVYYKKNYTGKVCRTFQFQIGNCLIKLPKKNHSYQNFDQETEERKLKIGSQFYLPVSLYVTKYLECSTEQKTYSKVQAKKEARRRLLSFLKDYETKGVVILKNNVKIDSDKNECTAKGWITIKERVGKIQEIPRQERKP